MSDESDENVPVTEHMMEVNYGNIGVFVSGGDGDEVRENFEYAWSEVMEKYDDEPESEETDTSTSSRTFG